MHFVEPSREVLAETLLAAGPDATTLCAGWRTRDLAAHLYLRERKVAVGLGLIIKRLSKASDQATAELAATLKTPEDYARLVNTFRAGPPALSPLRIKALDESSNLIEYFVHTEDVRRAVDRWAPRALDEAYSDALWDELVKRAAILYRGVDLGIVLVQPVGPAACRQARPRIGGHRRRAGRTPHARPRPHPPRPRDLRRPAGRRRAPAVRRSRPLDSLNEQRGVTYAPIIPSGMGAK